MPCGPGALDLGDPVATSVDNKSFHAAVDKANGDSVGDDSQGVATDYCDDIVEAIRLFVRLNVEGVRPENQATVRKVKSSSNRFHALKVVRSPILNRHVIITCPSQTDVLLVL